VGTLPNILILEDEPGQAATLVAELRRQAVPFTSINVERHDSLPQALENYAVDLILADHAEPSEKAFAALEAIHEQHPEIPFVILTSTCDPGLLVEIFECGAAGHVRRQHLEELAPIVLTALENARPSAALTGDEIIREVPAVDGPAAERTDGRHQETQPVCPRCKRIADSLGQWEQLEIYLRLHRQATIRLGMCPDCAQRERSLRDHEPASNRPSCRGDGVKRIP
jgi:DNA-binding NarL/FixJ family response regulator